MSDIKTSIIRTVVPYVVGAVVAFFASRGIDIDPDTKAAIGTLLTTLVGGLYYVAIRLLEKKLPKAGLLLGSAKTPEYKG